MDIAAQTPGTVLVLYDALPTAAIGYYVLLECDDDCVLCSVWWTEDGTFQPTPNLVTVSREALNSFDVTGLLVPWL